MRLFTSELVKKYKSRTVVNHVTIDVKQGEIVGLLGPNGAGKTTTMKMLTGLTSPNAGDAFVDVPGNKCPALIPFDQEMEHVECYLKIEKARFGDRLNVIYSIQCKEFSVPPLTVQPIVENAVKHGTSRKRGGGSVTISTRETEEVRTKVLRLGISQTSGASRTSVGGYTEEERPHDTEQFDVSDTRTLDEVVKWLMEMGHIPSFCTACYREGRTGDRFMELCKSGQIQNCCHPNALMTLNEYLEDYASPETKQIGKKLIQSELLKIPNLQVREKAKFYIDQENTGLRDIRF
mgnify:CR=1 FL=1